MDEPIRPRASVPTERKPRMRCEVYPRGRTQWRCTSGHVAGIGPTMEAAYAQWHRRVCQREALRLGDVLERFETFGVPMSPGDRMAAARMLERHAGSRW